ncbi:trimethylamine methyltransferase family protein [Desulfurivibrio dismutans]|uniref:trimethylamine methyltransferase family protein n=1 Tax=Desulfurivibrio dismutans TaxID=1398908 RepID=UPI0023DA891F|nr:trimethylamine methyltransferase family protein [Desulfurivibrio alkaliphilus]MDF1614320.1 trimethylamine methyltransferase family protein [Desulfurivibrio alkaliphilus]
MTEPDTFRQGTVVKPYERLNAEQIDLLDAASMKILEETGIWCYNMRAAELFAANGARVEDEPGAGAPCKRVYFPPAMVRKYIAMAPSKVVLGARDPKNRLVLDAEVPRVYFGSGSETNVWLETELEEFQSTTDPARKLTAPRYTEKRGDAQLLARAARLGEQLDHLDFFIRPVNVQDSDISEDDHDVNKFFACLNNITKHVQAGLTTQKSLDKVLKMAEIIAGGHEELRQNPVVSFIACVFKSPLQMVEDTTAKVFDMVEAGMPLVISSSPQGGSSAPIQEAGMVAQINAEILAGVMLTQLIKPGAPVLYGSVAVRARLDDLHDLYGCPEFNQYNNDTAQMARHYKIPCYSSSGVGNASTPGMQASFEKVFTHLYMGLTGAQYIHYSFGLLDRTNTFCPLQAVLDNEQVGLVKHCLRPPKVDQENIDEVLKMITKVMKSSHRLFTRHTRKATHAGEISEPYKFGAKEHQDGVIPRAVAELAKVEARPGKHLPAEVQARIRAEVPGIVDRLFT